MTDPHAAPAPEPQKPEAAPGRGMRTDKEMLLLGAAAICVGIGLMVVTILYAHEENSSPQNEAAATIDIEESRGTAHLAQDTCGCGQCEREHGWEYIAISIAQPQGPAASEVEDDAAHGEQHGHATGKRDLREDVEAAESRVAQPAAYIGQWEVEAQNDEHGLSVVVKRRKK